MPKSISACERSASPLFRPHTRQVLVSVAVNSASPSPDKDLTDEAPPSHADVAPFLRLEPDAVTPTTFFQATPRGKTATPVLALPGAPWLSVTVRATAYVPLWAYVCVIVAPDRWAPSPISQR